MRPVNPIWQPCFKRNARDPVSTLFPPVPPVPVTSAITLFQPMLIFEFQYRRWGGRDGGGRVAEGPKGLQTFSTASTLRTLSWPVPSFSASSLNVPYNLIGQSHEKQEPCATRTPCATFVSVLLAGISLQITRYCLADCLNEFGAHATFLRVYCLPNIHSSSGGCSRHHRIIVDCGSAMVYCYKLFHPGLHGEN